MKKIIFSLLGIAVIVIIAITSCQKPDEVINPNLNKLSFESFDINPDIITLSEGIDQKSTKALQVWVGADIAGAAVGATQSAIISYTTTGEVNWESVGLSAVGGAIVGSTGIIGKAGKWISNLFK